MTHTHTQGSGSALSYLEQRQEWVLGQITNLQDRVKVLGQQFGIGADQVGILQQVREPFMLYMCGGGTAGEGAIHVVRVWWFFRSYKKVTLY